MVSPLSLAGGASTFVQGFQASRGLKLQKEGLVNQAEQIRIERERLVQEGEIGQQDIDLRRDRFEAGAGLRESESKLRSLEVKKVAAEREKEADLDAPMSINDSSYSFITKSFENQVEARYGMELFDENGVGSKRNNRKLAKFMAEDKSAAPRLIMSGLFSENTEILEGLNAQVEEEVERIIKKQKIVGKTFTRDQVLEGKRVEQTSNLTSLLGEQEKAKGNLKTVSVLTASYEEAKRQQDLKNIPTKEQQEAAQLDPRLGTPESRAAFGQRKKEIKEASQVEGTEKLTADVQTFVDLTGFDVSNLGTKAARKEFLDFERDRKKAGVRRTDAQTYMDEIAKGTPKGNENAANLLLFQRADAFKREFLKSAGKLAGGEKQEFEKAIIVASRSIANIDRGLERLDSGIFTGPLANVKLAFNKYLKEFGVSLVGEKIADTEAFGAIMARDISNILGSGDFGRGTAISDEDRKFAARMVAGDITLDDQSIKEILDLNRKIAKDKIIVANNQLNRLESQLEAGDPFAGDPVVAPGAGTQGVSISNQSERNVSGGLTAEEFTEQFQLRSR